jgi:heme A synthase
VYPVGERSSLEIARALGDGQGHYLEQLRGVHPLLAAAAASFFIAFGARLSSRVGRAIVHATLLQVALGLVNIYLSAPGWMQVIHLALANLLWILWVVAWFAQADATRAMVE